MQKLRQSAPYLLSMLPLGLGIIFIAFATIPGMPASGRLTFAILSVVLTSITFIIWISNAKKSDARPNKKGQVASLYRPPDAKLPDGFSVELRGSWCTVGKYSRPNWDALFQHIRSNLVEQDQPNAIEQIAAIWIDRLLPAFGSDYQVYERAGLILVTTHDPETAGYLLEACASNVLELHKTFEIRDSISNNKLPIFLFHSPEAYYDYIAYFYPKRARFAQSSGVFLPGGYPHIALPDSTHDAVLMTLIHELTHACFSPLKIPLWLEEGIIRTIERKLGRFGFEPVISEREQSQHLRFWTPENIQNFWSGSSFSKPDPYSKLSYSLAEVLVTKLLAISKKQFASFVKNAKRPDAGESAAQDTFGFGIGEILSSFLGDKNWRPRS